MNRKYETVFVLNPNLGEEGLAATAEKIKALVETAASLLDFETWGNRRLAYEINDQREGYYFLMHFESDAQFPAELERVLKITEGVMRFLVIRMGE